MSTDSLEDLGNKRHFIYAFH